MADPAELFRRIGSGVYVIGVAQGDRRNAFTAAWLIQVSFEPLLLALSVNPGHASWPLLLGGGGFTVNVLAREQIHLARHFGTQSAREADKLAPIPWRPAPSGAPILDGVVAWLDCRMEQHVKAGDHEIAVARPVAGELLLPDAQPLSYADTGELDGSRELFPRSLGEH